MSPSPSLPLLHNGDSYHLYLEVLSPKLILLSRLVRYEGNQNVEGVEVSFRDLDHQAREAVVRQINRRYVGRTIKV